MSIREKKHACGTGAGMQPMLKTIVRGGMLLSGLGAGMLALWLERGREARAANAEPFQFMMAFADEHAPKATGPAERFMRLTDAVGDRVKPDYGGAEFAPTPAGVLVEGRGNCGSTANIMAYFAEVHGHEHRRLWVGPETGSQYYHAFAEIEVEPGRWAVFDPNLLRYALDEQGRPMSMEEIAKEPERSGPDLFEEIAREYATQAEVLRVSEGPRYELPFGRATLGMYRLLGPRGFQGLVNGEASLWLGMFAAMMTGGAIAVGRRNGGGGIEEGAEVGVEHDGGAEEGGGITTRTHKGTEEERGNASKDFADEDD